jgi:hypothetical protein
MGKSGPKQKVVDYRMSVHYGVCTGPVDELMSIHYGEKLVPGAIPIRVSEGLVQINQSSLNGGVTKEGGIIGDMHYYPGDADQVLSTKSADKYSKTPATSPAYRGICSLFFTEQAFQPRGDLSGTLATGARKGFLWGSNSPFIRPLWVTPKRIPKGWNEAEAGIPLPGSSYVDANPIHIIVECMTNPDWGMGGDLIQLELSTFLAASTVMIAEGLGLTMLWTKQSPIEDFVNDVLDHIEATLFINPRTGLFEIKLIRDDYDIATLPVLDKTNARVIDAQTKLWGETTNEIVVTWTNPDTEKAETVTLQDPGNIAIQNAVVSSPRNYHGVRSSDLAIDLCERDLRAVAAPLTSIQLEADKSAWQNTPGSVVIANFPEKNIINRVMRIGPVDYGGPRGGKIIFSLVEDVFASPPIEFTAPEGTGWDSPQEPPAVIATSEIITLPYYIANNVIDPALFASTDYPGVFSGVLAAQPGIDTFEFDMHGEVTDSLGVTTFTSFGLRPITSLGTLQVALTQEASSTLTLANFGTITQGQGPELGGFLFLGEGTDEAMEIAMISDFTDPNYTILRAVLDTTPKEWPIGTKVWFVPASHAIADNTVRADTQDVSYKLLAVTSLGILDVGLAPTITDTLNGRPHLPSRPANVTVGGVAFGELDATAGPDPIPVTWATRNRVLEETQVLSWTDIDVVEEGGQTTKIVVMDAARNVITEHTGLTGSSFNVPVASFGGASIGIIRVESERDGLVSLQGHEITVTLTTGWGSSWGFNWGG